jgi:hypothetical protein
MICPSCFITSQAKERVKKLLAHGQDFAAADLTEEIKQAELVAGFRALNFVKGDWAQLASCYLEISKLGYADRVPLHTKLIGSLRYCADLAAQGQWKKWALHIIPSLSLQIDGGWSMVNPRMGFFAAEVMAYKLESKVELAEDAPIESSLQSAIDESERVNPVSAAGRAFLEQIVELSTDAMVGNMFFKLVDSVATTKEKELILAKRRLLDFLVTYQTLAEVALPAPDSCFSYASVCFRLFKGLRGFIDPQPGCFTNVTLDETAFLVAGIKTGVSSLKDLEEIKSGKAICRMMARNENWKSMITEYKKYMGAGSARSEQLMEWKHKTDDLCKVMGELEKEKKDGVRIGVGGVADESGDSKQGFPRWLEDVMTFLNTYETDGKEMMEALRPGALGPLNMSISSLILFAFSNMTECGKSPIEIHKKFLVVACSVALVVEDKELYKVLNEANLELTASNAHSEMADVLNSNMDTPERLASAYEAFNKVKDVNPRDSREVALLTDFQHTCRSIIAENVQLDSQNDPTANQMIVGASKMLVLLAKDAALVEEGDDGGDVKYLALVKHLTAMYQSLNKAIHARNGRKGEALLQAHVGLFQARVTWCDKRTDLHPNISMGSPTDVCVTKIQDIGNIILKDVEQHFRQHASLILSQDVKSCKAKTSALSSIAGGCQPPQPDKVWCSHLHANSSDADVKKAFESSIGSAKFDGSLVDTRASSLAEADCTHVIIEIP